MRHACSRDTGLKCRDSGTSAHFRRLAHRRGYGTSGSGGTGWMSCVLGSRARMCRSAAVVGSEMPQEIALDSGCTYFASLAYWDRSSSSWKTYQRLLIGGGRESLGRFPRRGMTWRGRLYLRRGSALRSRANDYSLWPSPLASDSFRMKFSIAALCSAPQKKRGNFTRTEYLAEAVAIEFGGYLHPEFAEWLMGFPRGWTECDCD